MLRRPKKLSRLKNLKKIRRRKPMRSRFTVGTSKFEKEFKRYLNSLGIEVETQHPIAYSFYDFKVKGKDILIETDGDFWHCNPLFFPKGPINEVQRKAIVNDRKKNKLAAEHGYLLIRI